MGGGAREERGGNGMRRIHIGKSGMRSSRGKYCTKIALA